MIKSPMSENVGAFIRDDNISQKNDMRNAKHRLLEPISLCSPLFACNKVLPFMFSPFHFTEWNGKARK